MEVCGELQASTTLRSERNGCAHSLDPRAGLAAVENRKMSFPLQFSNPGPPTRNVVFVLTTLLRL